MIVVGTQFYDARGEAAVRQQRARAALLALDRVVRVNVQFVGDDHIVDGFRAVPLLRQDSRTVTHGAGVPKPIASEMFDVLATVARETGSRYFAYLNADVEVAPEAIEYIHAGDRTAYAFCRVDVDPTTQQRLGIQPYGADMFAIDVDWWTRERRRFRPYITGEMCWDNVYAALICCHGSGDIVNHREVLFHQRHASRWDERSPFAEYNGYLAALDAPYFSRWVRYVELLKQHAGTRGVDHDRLIREAFAAQPISAAEAAVNAARQLRARVQYFIRRRAARSISPSDGRNASSSGGE
jgi:hypothetical protein